MTTSLRQRMTEDMQIRNLSPLTQSCYVQQVSMFARHFGKSPAVLGLEDIRDYQLYRKRCSATLGRSASGWVVGLPVPWHQLVDAFLRPAVDEACQQIREIGLRIDAIEFASLDQ
jgi:hypothetical protein